MLPIFSRSGYSPGSHGAFRSSCEQRVRTSLALAMNSNTDGWKTGIGSQGVMERSTKSTCFFGSIAQFRSQWTLLSSERNRLPEHQASRVLPRLGSLLRLWMRHGPKPSFGNGSQSHCGEAHPVSRRPQQPSVAPVDDLPKK
jgi:hypothetical protein